MKRLTLLLAVALIAVAGCMSQPASTARPVPPTVPLVPPTTIPASTVAALTPVYSVQVTKDVEYTVPLQPQVRAQNLDVYAPYQPRLWPSVVFVSGYGAGKDTVADVLYGKELAGRGAIVFVPNWRASTALESAKNNRAVWREALHDVACAVR